MRIWTLAKRFAQIAGAIFADTAKRHTATLGGAIGTDQRQADQFEKAHDARRHGRAAIGDIFDPAAEGAPHVRFELCFELIEAAAVGVAQTGAGSLVIETFEISPAFLIAVLSQ